MKVSIQEVKEALRDSKFRLSLPEELKDDIRKYEQNPNCPCNLEIYRKILKIGSKQLREYYPGKDIVNPDTELPPLQENRWKVVSCHIDQIENELKKFQFGRFQIAVARWEDQATIIFNEIG